MSEDSWKTLKAWCDKKIARLKSQGEFGKSTPIGRGQLMAMLSVVEEMERLAGEKKQSHLKLVPYPDDFDTN